MIEMVKITYEVTSIYVNVGKKKGSREGGEIRRTGDHRW